MWARAAEEIQRGRQVYVVCPAIAPGEREAGADEENLGPDEGDAASYTRKVTASTTDPLIGRLIDGRYQVRSRIARGGMATVYEGRDRRLERHPQRPHRGAGHGDPRPCRC